jgi:hypothetical protein
LNFFAFLLFLVFMPETPVKRVVFLVGLVIITWLHVKIVSRLAKSKVYFGATSKSQWQGATLSAIAAIATSAIGGALAILLYTYLLYLGWPFKE